ncbi:MAG: hypothetical protein ACJA16_000116 [Akkermansiaceae bacterium]|jgi:hypothetical protein
MKTFTFLALTTSITLAEVEIYPTLHFSGLVGETSAESFGDVGGHAHDPNDSVALQGLDAGLNLKVDDWFAAFVNINAFTTGPDHDLESELEEGFAKLENLPGGFEIRGGRFLNRIGLQNNRHLHSWNFVNANLSSSQFLGEEGLITEGIEVTWMKEFDQSFLALTASYGKAPEHEEHGDEEEEHEEEEGHGHEAAEDAYFNQELMTARALFGYNHNDFHQHRFGLNGAWGDNGYGRDTNLHSIDYTYTWRENGLESGGRSFAIGAEYFHRDVQWTHPENTANQGSSSQNGYMAFASYRFAEEWIADLRYEHLQGRSAGPELDMGEIEYAFDSAARDRFSVALTREFQYKETNSHLRLQYSHDDTSEGKDDSIFLQFGFNFGQGEVR